MRALTCGFYLFFVASFAFAKTSIIPQPKSVTWGQGAWRIPHQSQICFHRKAARSAEWLQKLVAPLSHVTMAELSACKAGSFILNLDPELQGLGVEGYRLSVTRQGVVISSRGEEGLFYAIQTLRQMLPASLEQSQSSKKQNLSLVEIEDMPAHSWRGSMLDIARSFFGVEYIKQHIERMALFKLNRLHLHLTDDQGWRIEIKGYPNLTSHGGRGAVNSGKAGYLTQEQYKQIQQYAADRNIIVIPEIDMPGHIYSALSSYPELNCQNFENLSPKLAIPPELYRGVSVKWNSLCLEKPEVHSFVHSVLQELAAMTVGPWIHIGGDEVDNPHYKAFVSSATETVLSLGKTPMGWQEILSAPINSNAIAQIWSQDVATNNPKIISLCQNFYLDHSNTPTQGLPNDWCKKDGVSLENLYGYTFAAGDNILGVEAAVWTEFANTQQQIDDRLWPRLAAAAEVAWSQEANRNIDDFRSRLGPMGARFDRMGISFFETPTVQWARGKRLKSPSSVFLDFAPKGCQVFKKINKK